MRSKKKKLLFICFSALIMIGLMIGVFADYNVDRLGTVVGSTPYDLGDLVVDFDSSESFDLTSGYYIFKYDIYTVNNSSDDVIYIQITDHFNAVIEFIGSWKVLYTYSGYTPSYLYFDGVGSYYVYSYFPDDVHIVKAGVYDDSKCSVSIYSINDYYSINIYDNSQDVWASVVSVVNDATDSVINNDILLMFAAAIPVISFGVGMLIRLYHKS